MSPRTEGQGPRSRTFFWPGPRFLKRSGTAVPRSLAQRARGFGYSQPWDRPEIMMFVREFVCPTVFPRPKVETFSCSRFALAKISSSEHS